MKRSVFALFLVCLLFSSCQDTPAPSAYVGTELTAAQMVERMTAGVTEVDNLVSTEEDDLDAELEAYYGLAPEQWSDAAIVRAGGASAFEVSVVVLPEDADSSAVAAAQTGLQNYLLSRQGDFTGYAPDQAKLAENGTVLVCGRYLALIIAENAESISAAFEDCFAKSVEEYVGTGNGEEPSLENGRVPYVDPKLDDMTIYDTSAILSAWESGDRSALTDFDSAILSAAEEVLSKCLTEDMSDYDKERAVYRWVTQNVDYDWDHQDPAKGADPNSYNPYGGLINHTAVCLGFASTFQLLMDLAHVECITVIGAAFSSTENHAWNMIRLNGNWYCADTTWDIDTQTSAGWSYFNVTSDWMAKTDHQWDYGAVPEATATDGGEG